MSLAFCLDVFGYLLIFPTMSRPDLSVVALVIWQIRLKYHHVDQSLKYHHVDPSFKLTSAAVVPNYKCVKVLGHLACPGYRLNGPKRPIGQSR